MTPYDWIVVGGGITGAALTYELAKQGLNVLLLERDPDGPSATRYSYGGLAYWAGTTPLTQQLGAEGLAIYRQLAAELEAETEFRELDLLLTVAPTADPVAVAATYQGYAITPTVLDQAQACDLEPQLNPAALSGALRLPHAHIHPQKVAAAYRAASQRLGAAYQPQAVLGFLQAGERVVGVQTAQDSYRAAQVALCAGGWSRSLLQAAGLSWPLYFTQAEILAVPPVPWQLQALIMPAQLQRFDLERRAAAQHQAWEHPGQEVAPAILDVGAIQFRDRSLYLGQISGVVTDPEAPGDAAQGTDRLRAAATHLLPALAGVSSHWRRCLVAFSPGTEPAIGPLPHRPGLHLFAGFPNSLVATAPLARHFAAQAAGAADAVMAQVVGKMEALGSEQATG